MGTKVQRKLYFLSISDKVLLCVDSGTSSPIDNPEAFSGRSDIPSSAKCIELKPNYPNSTDGFCPNSGVIIPEKSYVDYDETTDTLILQRATADGSCGYSFSPLSINLQKDKVYTYYVRAMFVRNRAYRLEGGTSGGSGHAGLIETHDHYYYVFSSLEGAVNWDLTKMVHGPDEVMSILSPSPIYASTSTDIFRPSGRINPYLMTSTNPSNIKPRYRLNGVPPSTSSGAGDHVYDYQYQQYQYFNKYDNQDQVNSAEYLLSKYILSISTSPSVQLTLFRIFDSSLNPPNSGASITLIRPRGANFIFWPLMFDKFKDVNTFERYGLDQVSNVNAQTGIIMEWAHKLNSVYNLGHPGIYDPQMNVNIQINSVQIYPLERSNNQKLFLDKRFNYPPASSFPDFIPPIGYAIEPALYHSSLTNSLGTLYDQIKLDDIFVYKRLSSSSSISIPGRYWGVSDNCDLVSFDVVGGAVTTLPRNVTEMIPSNYRNIFVQGGNKPIYTNIYDFNVSYTFNPNTRGQLSLKYVVDIIYTVRISKGPISYQPVETVNPPAVCPPVELSVRKHSDILS